MIENNAVIYWMHLSEHTDPSTEGYIGVTKNLEVRLRQHLDNINKAKHKNPHLTRAVAKYGWDNIIKDIILVGEEAYCYEIEETMRPSKAMGWNIAPGGHRGPGWTTGKKKSKESIEKQRQTMAPVNEAKRLHRLEARRKRLAERETKRKLKETIITDKKNSREKVKTARLLKLREAEMRRENRRLTKIENGTTNVSTSFANRPICETCNKNQCAVNYHRNGKTYYRSMCDECGRKKNKLKPRVASWQKSDYKKKATCDLCGFKGLFTTQLTVFHIDGKLENVQFSNLRTICLNCVEVVKKTQVTWKRGDLKVD